LESNPPIGPDEIVLNNIQNPFKEKIGLV